ncbi:MAG: hypothetical protein KJ799_11980 [Bacteroidetes bacterium]|nr:hypothetical protein [Bacteroidota bacterium]
MKFNNRNICIFVCALSAAIAGCSYSFTGASVPPHLQTIAISIVQDRSNKGEPNLDNLFTDELINKFLNDNTLEVTDKNNADALLECTILSLSDSPELISGDREKATTRRMTITVKVQYKDLVNKKSVFDKNFSNYETYDTESDFISARNSAIEAVVDYLTEDILLGVVSNW